MNLVDDDRWPAFGVSGAFLEEKAAWLAEPRLLHNSSLRFFEESGRLIALSRYDYPLASIAFFHAIPGLERALKLHFRNEDAKLGELLGCVLRDGLISDSLFANRPPFTDTFAETVERQAEEKCGTHSELLVGMIPKLRNQYFHGTYLLAPDYLHLTIQLRPFADALTTKNRH